MELGNRHMVRVQSFGALRDDASGEAGASKTRAFPGWSLGTRAKKHTGKKPTGKRVLCIDPRGIADCLLQLKRNGDGSADIDHAWDKCGRISIA